MNTGVLKVLQRHVIACRHVLVCDGHLKPLPCQILILNKVSRSSSRGLRRRRRFCHRWDLHKRRILRVWINIQNLDGGIMDRKHRRSGPSPPSLWRLVLSFFLPPLAWKVPWINSFWYTFYFFTYRWTRLSFTLPNHLVHHLFAFVFLHSCHP